MKRTLILVLISTFLISSTISITHTVSAEQLDQLMLEQTSSNIVNRFIETEKPKELFKIWHHVFKPLYSLSAEAAIDRYRAFKANLKLIKETNAQDLSYKFGLNQFSDLTNEEFTAKYLNRKPLTSEELLKLSPKKPSFLQDLDEDDEEDGRRNLQTLLKSNHSQFMRPIRNQGNCGSCWAFATSCAIEGVLNKAAAVAKTSALVDYLSTQQLVDCDLQNGGCNGGWGFGALDYAKTTGLVSEECYKYEGVKATCRLDNLKPGKKITGYQYCSGYSSKPCTDVDFINNLLSKGPLMVGIDARWIQNYASGIFTFMKKNATTGVTENICTSDNHAVVAVGYVPATTTVAAHYIVRNSWGASWGEQGSIRVSKTKRTVTAKITGPTSSCYIDNEGLLPLA